MDVREEVPERRAERRNASGVGFAGLPTENAPELGRDDSSVLSEILLRRMRGSAVGLAVERRATVGSDTYDGEPVYPVPVNVPDGRDDEDHSVSACSVLSNSSSRSWRVASTSLIELESVYEAESEFCVGETVMRLIW